MRLTGRNGSVREFNALVDPGADYCVVPKVDAHSLGYREAAIDNPITLPANAVTFSSYNGCLRAVTIKMAQVDLGSASFRNVDFVAIDLPQVTGFDVILGRNLLRFMKLEFDFSVGHLRVEDIRKKSVEA